MTAAGNVGAAPDGKLWARVCDRAAGTFECLEHVTANGHPFASRSCQNRALEADAADEGPRLLHDRARALEARAGWEVGVSAQKATKTQPARAARRPRGCW